MKSRRISNENWIAFSKSMPTVEEAETIEMLEELSGIQIGRNRVRILEQNQTWSRCFYPVSATTRRDCIWYETSTDVPHLILNLTISLTKIISSLRLDDKTEALRILNNDEIRGRVHYISGLTPDDIDRNFPADGFLIIPGGRNWNRKLHPGGRSSCRYWLMRDRTGTDVKLNQFVVVTGDPRSGEYPDEGLHPFGELTESNGKQIDTASVVVTNYSGRASPESVIIETNIITPLDYAFTIIRRAPTVACVTRAPISTPQPAPTLVRPIAPKRRRLDDHEVLLILNDLLTDAVALINRVRPQLSILSGSECDDFLKRHKGVMRTVLDGSGT